MRWSILGVDESKIRGGEMNWDVLIQGAAGIAAVWRMGGSERRQDYQPDSYEMNVAANEPGGR